MTDPTDPNPFAAPGTHAGQLAYFPDDAARRKLAPWELEQAMVNSWLNRGVAFSIFWVCGFGSVYAIYLALKARRVIKRSGGNVHGMRRVLWCLIVGAFGVSFWTVPIIMGFVND